MGNRLESVSSCCSKRVSQDGTENPDSGFFSGLFTLGGSKEVPDVFEFLKKYNLHKKLVSSFGGQIEM